MSLASESDGAVRRRSGRRPGDSGTKGEILRAARRTFATYGYRDTTMRMIAREAKVDAALIHHFFTSKAGVYAASVASSFDLEALIGKVIASSPEEAAEVLVREFLEVWASDESREPMLAVLRSAVSHDEAAEALTSHVIGEAVGRITEAFAPSAAGLRATLISSQLIGMALQRYVLRAEPIASVSPQVILGWLVPTIDRYLTGQPPGGAPASAGEATGS
jgi:AcrR family transcriptional regulator